MQLRIPPILFFLFTALCMYVLKVFLPVGNFDFFGRYYLMSALLLLAFIISVAALWQFYKARTTIDPRKPERTITLETKGMYSFSRNPMYLALLLVLLAWGLWLGNAFNTILAAGFVSVMNKLQIRPEETVLQKKFGKAYGQYYIRVRRWF
jgi:protein-S-isoprenylcysteine O-methyltransferase Ste14